MANTRERRIFNPPIRFRNDLDHVDSVRSPSQSQRTMTLLHYQDPLSKFPRRSPNRPTSVLHDKTRVLAAEVGIVHHTDFFALSSSQPSTAPSMNKHLPGDELTTTMGCCACVFALLHSSIACHKLLGINLKERKGRHSPCRRNSPGRTLSLYSSSIQMLYDCERIRQAPCVSPLQHWARTSPFRHNRRGLSAAGIPSMFELTGHDRGDGKRPDRITVTPTHAAAVLSGTLCASTPLHHRT